MRFTARGPFRENIYALVRRAGYQSASLSKGRNRQKDEFEFARPVREYPRFHLFVNTEGENFIFKLHLDQKKPIYQGVPAHTGEYDSELVKREAERIKEILKAYG